MLLRSVFFFYRSSMKSSVYHWSTNEKTSELIDFVIDCTKTFSWIFLVLRKISWITSHKNYESRKNIENDKTLRMNGTRSMRSHGFLTYGEVCFFSFTSVSKVRIFMWVYVVSMIRTYRKPWVSETTLFWLSKITWQFGSFAAVKVSISFQHITFWRHLNLNLIPNTIKIAVVFSFFTPTISSVVPWKEMQ